MAFRFGHMDYVRAMYAVPARRGGRVLVNGWPGRITSAGPGGRLRILMNGEKHTRVFHPTDPALKYIERAAA